MRMARAGAVWVDVIPNMAAFGTSIRAGARVPLAGFGTQSGRDFTSALVGSTKAGMAGFAGEVRAGADKAAAAVAVASGKVATARDREAKAAGTVRVAELRLQELRATGKASASQMATAEERLATAVRGSASAETSASTAARQLGAAQVRAAEASTAAATAAASGTSRMGQVASTGISKVSSGITGLVKQGAGLGAMFAGFAAADFLAHSVKSAGDFQKEMNVLVTAGGESEANLKGVAAGIQSIAVETGTSLSNLSAGMYTIEKAGLRGADGLKVLRAAAQGAKDENVGLDVMTNALTSMMTSYHQPAAAAVQDTNELIAASGAAKTTMANFAGSLSTVLPIASSAGLSFAQVGGAIATLTNHGTSADQATQDLAFSIRSLQAPNRVAVNAMAQLGISSNDVSTQLGKRGLTGTLDLLSTTVLSRMGPSGTMLLNTFNQSKVAGQDADRMFRALPPSVQAVARSFQDGTLTAGGWHKAVRGMPAEQASLAAQWGNMETKAKGFNSELRGGGAPAQTYQQAMKNMTGGAAGLATALQLTGENTGRFNANVAAVSAASKNAGTDVAAWGVVQQSLNVQMDRLGQSVGVAGVKLGTALIPALTKIVQGTAGAVTGVTNFVTANSAWLKPVAAGVGAFALAYQGTLLAVRGGGAIIRGAQGLYQGLATAIRGATIAEDGLNTAGKFNPIGLIALGVGAAVTGLMAWRDHTQKQKQAVQDLTDAIKADNGVIGDNTKSHIVNQLQTDGTLAKYRALGVNLGTVTSAYLGNGQALAQVSDRLTGYVKAGGNSATFNGQYGTVVSGVTQKMRDQAQTAGELSQSMTGQNDAISGAVQQGRDYAAAMKGSATETGHVAAAAHAAVPHLSAAQIATAHLKDDTAKAASADKALQTGMDNVSKALSGLTTQYFGVGSAQDVFQGKLNAVAQAAAGDATAAAKVVSAQDGQAKASGALRVAELRLQELRVKGHASAATLAAAEERVASAQRASTKAATGVTTALQSQKTGMQGTSDTAIAFRGSIRDAVGSLADLVSAEIKHGDSSGKIVANFDTQRSSLERTLRQMGLGPAAIAAYTAPLNDIPGMIKTNVTLPGIAARQAEVQVQADKLAALPPWVSTRVTAPNAVDSAKQIQAVHDGLFGLPALTSPRVQAPGAVDSTGKVQSVWQHLHDLPANTNVAVAAQGIKNANLDLASVGTAAGKIPTKVGVAVSITTNAKDVYQKLLSLGPNVATAAQGLKNQRLGLATGGPVVGPGGPREDKVPLWGSNGEYMINAKSTAKHRPLVEAINRDVLPRYADGGPIANSAGSTWKATTSPAGMLGAGSAFSPMIATVPPKVFASVAGQAEAALQAMFAGNGGGVKSAAGILAEARRFLGTPYLWGGTEPGGFDCSGLVQYVLNALGMHPPRTAAQQEAWTTPISSGMSGPGDLVFFDRPAGHVGIDEGNGRMIDAPHSGARVREENIWPGARYGRIPGMQAAGGAMPTGAMVTRWAPLVAQTLGELGLSQSGGMIARVLRQIKTESGGDPNATQGNIGDVNNRTGDLGRGLMQVIRATFNANAGPYRDLGQYNPHANIYAGLNYARGRYGSDLSYLGQGHGYDTGGLWPSGAPGMNLSGRPERVLNPTQTQHFEAAMNRVGAVAAAEKEKRQTVVRVEFRDDRLKDLIDVRIDESHDAHATLLAYGTG